MRWKKGRALLSSLLALAMVAGLVPAVPTTAYAVEEPSREKERTFAF